jgi:hypothetical protein
MDPTKPRERERITTIFRRERTSLNTGGDNLFA